MWGDILNWIIKKDEEYEANLPENTKNMLKYVEAISKFQKEVWDKLSPEDKFFTLLYLEIKGHFLVWYGFAVIMKGWDYLFYKFYDETPVKNPFINDVRYLLLDSSNRPFIGVSLNGKNFVLSTEDIEEYIRRKGIPVDRYFQSEEVKKAMEFLAELAVETELAAVKRADRNRTEEEINASIEACKLPVIQKFNLDKSWQYVLPCGFGYFCYKYDKKKGNHTHIP